MNAYSLRLQNRMKESLSLFYTTIHSPWFASASIILFLNKMDILEEKIKTSDLKTYFAGFDGMENKYLCTNNSVNQPQPCPAP